MKFELIAFDADDTLWQNEELYQLGRERFERLLAGYPLNGKAAERLNEIEIQNLQYYGYGVNSFVLSMIEAAIELTAGEITGAQISDLIALAKEMLTAKVQLYEHVDSTLEKLSAAYPLMLITKGDLLHQQAKIEKSGIKDYFRYVEVVSEKSTATYAAILERYHLPAEGFLMVGNSLRSDILPVVEIGGWAVHIPSRLSWSHEMGTPPDQAHSRYYELTQLSQLPELLIRLQAEL